jgi:DNA-binding response OmpR family regulator
MKALLRRARPRDVSKLTAGPLQFDEKTMTLKLSGKPVELSPLEARAAFYFIQRPGKVISPAELAEQVQGRGEDSGNNAVEALMARLRKKLGSDIILTRRGFGYYLPEQSE